MTLVGPLGRFAATGGFDKRQSFAGSSRRRFRKHTVAAMRLRWSCPHSAPRWTLTQRWAPSCRILFVDGSCAGLGSSTVRLPNLGRLGPGVGAAGWPKLPRPESRPVSTFTTNGKARNRPAVSPSTRRHRAARPRCRPSARPAPDPAGQPLASDAFPSAVDGLLDRELSGKGADGLEGALLAIGEHCSLVRLRSWPRLSRGDDLHCHATVIEKNCPIKDACDRRLEHLLVQPVPEVIGGRLYRHQSQYLFNAGWQVAADNRFSLRPLHYEPV